MVGKGRRAVHRRPMVKWGRGLTDKELEEAQARYGVRFPPDMLDLYRERWPTEAYDWSKEDPRIREKLTYPVEMLLWDVEHGSWWLEWGEKPTDKSSREEVVRDAVAAAPTLIPLYSHRFIPETPHEPGNPVFSMHGFDTIYYGGDLEEYFANEFEGEHRFKEWPIRHIPFWSDLASQDHRWIFEEE